MRAGVLFGGRRSERFTGIKGGFTSLPTAPFALSKDTFGGILLMHGHPALQRRGISDRVRRNTKAVERRTIVIPRLCRAKWLRFKKNCEASFDARAALRLLNRGRRSSRPKPRFRSRSRQ